MCGSAPTRGVPTEEVALYRLLSGLQRPLEREIQSEFGHRVGI